MASTARIQKEDLFDDFYLASRHALDELELRFDIRGAAAQVFTEGADEADEKRALRSNPAWKVLSNLYEYAVNGIDSSEDAQTSYLVTEGAEVLELVTTHARQPAERWEEILWMADGRFGLDEGQPIDIRKAALLANVDVRTVRNAISAGDLNSFKTNDGFVVDNATARRWLRGRKGFTATVIRSDMVGNDLTHVNSPLQLGAFLTVRREQLNKTVLDAPPSLQPAIERIEAGTFDMSLDIVFPLAQYYALDRKNVLHCVMRVFFREMLDLLASGPGTSAQ